MTSIFVGLAPKEQERNTDIDYVIQSGLLQNLSVRWRNVTDRGSETTDVDENRLIVAHTLKSWQVAGQSRASAYGLAAPERPIRPTGH
ncbi:OprD family outer membrane porin [Pseudomonas sp.]|uniref:OprD family outer membrane porin n=1 Tax=Pseudomonas sp. TaxID=306 RepID=UPI0031B5A3B7